MSSKNTAEAALELGRAMIEMRNASKQLIQGKIKEHRVGISFEMLEILAVLWNEDGINQQEIADIVVKDKSTMTYLIDQLVKKALVKKEEDGGDRRNKLIFLTFSGRQLRKRLQPWVLDIYGRAAENIRVEEIQKSLGLVRKMTENLKALKEEVSPVSF